MKIVSIDVGIRNLSLCVFEIDSNNKIIGVENWQVIDLCEVPVTNKCCQITCNKKGVHVPCTFIAKYIKPGNSNNYFCTKHAKHASPYILPCKVLTNISKRKLGELVELAKIYNLDSSGTRSVIIERLTEYRNKYCFETVLQGKNASQEFPDVALGIMSKLDLLFDGKYETIDRVIIENQMSQKMQVVQGMLTQFFITRNKSVKVEYISASNKLKEWASELGINIPKSSKEAYKERKKVGIIKCGEIVEKTECLHTWQNYLAIHKKKDDLADAFLQGWWYIISKLSDVVCCD